LVAFSPARGGDAKRGAVEKRSLRAGSDRVESRRRDDEHALRGIVDVVFRDAEPAQDTPDEIEMRLEKSARAIVRADGMSGAGLTRQCKR
jgi:hypothetical protein